VVALAACLALPLAVIPWRSTGKAVGQATPNVVFIVADDMRYDGLQAMPFLGQLAERGISFRRYFATTSTCCPSRASMLTGLYAHNHGVLKNTPPEGGVDRFDDRSTLATWLQSVGVRTGLVGRYLNGYRGLDIPPGWDYWFAMLQTAADDDANRNIMYYRYRVNENGVPRYFGAAPNDYSTRVIGRRARSFLEAEKGRPFFLWVTPRAPHGPLADELDRGKFRTVDLPLPPSYDEADVSDKPHSTRELKPLTEAQHKSLQAFRRGQLEALLGLDRAIESIVGVLRLDGRLENTWIIFTSDNGKMIGEHRWRGHKNCAYEECAHVPLIIVPPGGLEAPRTEARLVANIDLAPTIAAIMAARPQGPVDGVSLVPMLSGRSDEWREALVLEGWENSAGETFQAIRTADRKYVRYENGEEELYDLEADPYELENLASDPASADEKASLARRLEDLLKQSAPLAAGLTRR
jgi:arylsulfatase A-like enzyme